jgi:hypothetical protein
MPLIKKACVYNRRLKHLRKREDELMDLRDEIVPIPSNQRRILEIEQQLIDAANEINQLLSQVWRG